MDVILREDIANLGSLGEAVHGASGYDRHQAAQGRVGRDHSERRPGRLMFQLTGQTAIVTGAATGIGEAIARRLARAGATIAVADLNADGAREVAASIGGESFGIGIDITRSDSAQQAIAEVLSRRRRIDVLVNNARLARRAAPLC